ncbi:hypothetical protein SLS58_006557 [Diplodia intermedia]|uniref:Protein kinase domain-containing protein n=1 Tax=Diplodia intermedia TaxID=856260 RepID=A0ABR3TMT3_9PEZI
MAVATTTDPLSGQSNRYANLPLVGNGMTGRILRLGDDRVVKVARTFPLDHLTGKERGDTEYFNAINAQALENERNVYERLGSHRGIIQCFQATNDGIELAFADQGSLDTYIESRPEPHDNVKLGWIASLTDTFCHVHSRRVFVDEIALRNFVIAADGSLKLIDFGQAVLLPLEADPDTICENDLTAKIEILHLGCIIYSIVTWTPHKYYYFNPDPHRPKLQDIPLADHLLCGTIIRKCWNGEYANVDALNKEVRASMVGTDLPEPSHSGF